MKLINPRVIRETHAKKFYVCEKCGRDIIPGDMYYSYKPLPNLVRGRWRSDTWRRRCWDCKPVYYMEARWYDKP